MVATRTLNISFPKDLLAYVDRVAKAESRSRSELLREAARMYIERKRRWERIFAWGETQARRLKLKPQDVEGWIAQYRRSQARHAA